MTQINRETGAAAHHYIRDKQHGFSTFDADEACCKLEMVLRDIYHEDTAKAVDDLTEAEVEKISADLDMESERYMERAGDLREHWAITHGDPRAIYAEAGSRQVGA